MADTGAVFAGTGASIAGSHTNWTNPTRIVASDNSYATCAMSSAGESSDFLAATSFGFSVSPTASVDGVVCDIEAKTSSTTVNITQVFLTKDGSTSEGSDQESGTNPLTTSDAHYTYGTSSSVWGTTLTPAEVNASTFGVLLSVSQGLAGSRTASVDAINVTVYYTPAATGSPDREMPRGVLRGVLRGVARWFGIPQRPELSPVYSQTRRIEVA